MKEYNSIYRSGSQYWVISCLQRLSAMKKRKNAWARISYKFLPKKNLAVQVTTNFQKIIFSMDFSSFTLAYANFISYPAYENRNLFPFNDSQE